MPEPRHVVLEDAPPPLSAWRCQHCGEVFRYAVPLRVATWVALAHAFVVVHRHCRPPTT
jgi:hypothetical protein